MTRYILIAELTLIGRKVYTYTEEQKHLLDKFVIDLKSNDISYEVWEIGEFGFTSKISGECYE